MAFYSSISFYLFFGNFFALFLFVVVAVFILLSHTEVWFFLLDVSGTADLGRRWPGNLFGLFALNVNYFLKKHE